MFDEGIALEVLAQTLGLKFSERYFTLFASDRSSLTRLSMSLPNTMHPPGFSVPITCAANVTD
jgi:hypothetical protein